jgi:hypothetical protein
MEKIKIFFRTKKTIKIFCVIILVLFLYNLSIGILVDFSKSNKSLENFIVSFSLKNSCIFGKSGCDELRPLPKPLQNKKIVFSKNTEVKYDPYQDSYRDNTELDLLGFIDAELYRVGNYVNFVNPILKKEGDLEEREYKIVRAVYHYNCSICIDSSDYSYIVLEDSKGNRFTALLNDEDISVTPWKKLPWDENLPYFMGKDKDGKEILYAKLENI